MDNCICIMHCAYGNCTFITTLATVRGRPPAGFSQYDDFTFKINLDFGQNQYFSILI